MKKIKNILKIKDGGFMQYVAYFALGAIASLGFAPFYLWWLTVIGIGGAYYLTIRNIDTRCERFFPSLWRIYPFSAAYAIGMFWWVVNSIYVVPELAAQFAIWTAPAIIGIGLLGGLVFAIPFVSIRCTHRYPANRPFLFAALWTFILWLREWFLTGFPWNPIANISMPYSIISNSMSLWGAIGLTFVLVGLIASITEIINRPKARGVFFPISVFTFLMIIGIMMGYKNIKDSEIKNIDTQPIVRIVQPARSASDKATHSREQAIKNAEANIVNLSQLASANGEDIDLLVFPETTYPYLLMDEDLGFVKNLGVRTIIGANTYDAGRFYNSMIITDTTGKVEKIYSKSHLVPFGEYRPFGDIVPTPMQLTPGDGAEVISMNLDGQVFDFVPAICYEIIFSDSLVPRDAAAVPRVVINITNDTWFGKTPGTYQHLDMVRRYAIESGLPIIRANYSGISAFVASDGAVVSQLPIGATGSLDGMLGGEHITPYREIGRDLWMVIILMFSIICSISISGSGRKD